MKPISEYDEESICSEELFIELLDQEDVVTQAEMINAAEDRADQLKVGKKFRRLLRAYKKVATQKDAPQAPPSLMDQWTNFSGGPYDRMKCKSWIATDEGIFQPTNNPFTPNLLACYHPILPIERLKNLETGDEQIKIAFKRSQTWEEIIVPKTVITSSTKIVALSAKGVAVTSENAKHLVRYLSDVENLNDDAISVEYSTSKLGWMRDGFMPYSTDIVFDGDNRFRDLFASVSERGSRESWIKHMKKIRAGCVEVRMMLAASFASVLVSKVGGLPFIVDLWGETEGGKTVSLMVAASVWADPADSRYIGDFKSTDTALEAKADMLNHMPLILDDTSKVSQKLRDNFEGMVYDLCSGKGKSRSNKELGASRENHWQNCILTSGERPMQSYVNQGGAINRILEIECGRKLFDDPHETAEIVKKNYGFAGMEFVRAVQEMGKDEILRIQEDIFRQINSDNQMQKQTMSLSIVLTADKIATERIFQDNQYIPYEAAKKSLIDAQELSDNERAYWYLMDKINMNQYRFDDEDDRVEKWGMMDEINATQYAIIYNPAFDALCRDGQFSRKSFLSWAVKKGVVICDSRGNPTKLKKIDKKPVRCVHLLMLSPEDDFPNDINFHQLNSDELIFD